MGISSRSRGSIYFSRSILLACLLAIACLPAFPQNEAAQSPQILQSYEGQNVSSVEIDGRPELDEAKYAPLIEQKKGEPFSTAKISATISALKKTGNFTDVVLDLRPETDGVRVMFVAEPAYYVALYEFPGALKVYSYSRLIQVANYMAQEPYSAVDVQQAQVNLEKFFHQTGYFEATVQPEIRVNEQHRIVNVLFNTELRKRARFGQVNLTGATPQDDAYLEGKIHSLLALLHGARIKEGKPYSSATIRDATTYMQGALEHQHYLAAQVKFVTAEYDAATNIANLTFHIQAGPKVKIDVNGAFLWPWTKKSLIPIYAENSVDPELIQEGEQNLVSYFQSKGLFDAVVQTKVVRSAKLTTIRYVIRKNAKHKVESVTVTGNTAFSTKDLLNHSDVEKAHWWLFSHGQYSEQLLRKSVDNLKAVYQNAGYSSVQITPRVTRDHGNIEVTYVVQQGARDYVSQLRIIGNKAVPVAQLAPKGLMLGDGKPYSPLLEQQDRNNITAHYLLNGYLTANVIAKATPVKGHPHQINVTYRIHEGPQVIAQQVLVLGEKQTRQNLIFKTANIQVGKPLSESELFTSESKLYTLGIFDWAEVDPRRAITDETNVTVLVKVHESKRNAITYGFGFEVINRGGSLPSGTVSVPGIPPVGLPQGFRTSEATYYGPRGTFEYTRKNLRGTAQSLTLGGFGGRLDQRGSATYNDPFFLGTRWSSSYLLSGEHDSENPIFSSSLATAALQFQRYLDPKKTATLFLRYNFQYTDLTRLLIPQLVPLPDRHLHLSTLSASWVRDTRDNVLNAHKGFYESLEAGITPGFLGSSDSFARFIGQISHYKNIGHGIIWANNLRIGLEEPYGGSHVPISEEFFTGGGSTLRGFPLNGAGPQEYLTVCGNPSDPSTCGPITVPTGGNQLLIVNTEFRIPLDEIKKGLGIVPFYDGGNVYKHVGFSDFTTNCNAATVATGTSGGSTVTTVTPSCFTSSVGIGFRYATPVGPVRIDIGHNLNHISGIKSNQVFITLGQAF